MAAIVDPEHINVVCYAFIMSLAVWISANLARLYTWYVLHKAVTRGTFYQYSAEDLRTTSLKQKVLDDARQGAGQQIQIMPITPLRFYLRQRQISLQVIAQNEYIGQTPTLSATRRASSTNLFLSDSGGTSALANADGTRAFVFEGKAHAIASTLASPQTTTIAQYHHARNGTSSSMDYSSWGAPGSAMLQPQVSSAGFEVVGTPSTVLQEGGFGGFSGQPLYMGFDVAVHQATHTRSIAASALLTVSTTDLMQELWQSLIPHQTSSNNYSGEGSPPTAGGSQAAPPSRRLWGGLVKFMSRISVGTSTTVSNRSRKPLFTPISTLRPASTIRRRGNSTRDAPRTPQSAALIQQSTMGSGDFESARSSAAGTPTRTRLEAIPFPLGDLHRTLSSQLAPLTPGGQPTPMMRADGGKAEFAPPAPQLRLESPRGSSSLRIVEAPNELSERNERSNMNSESELPTSPLQARRWAHGRQPLTIEVPQLQNATPSLQPSDMQAPPREPHTPNSGSYPSSAQINISQITSPPSPGIALSSPTAPYPPPHYRSIAFANPMFGDQLTQLEFLAEATTSASPAGDPLDAAVHHHRRDAGDTASSAGDSQQSPHEDTTIPIVVVVEELPPVIPSRRLGLIYTSMVSPSTVAQLASPTSPTQPPLFDLQLSFMRNGADLYRLYPIYNASTEEATTGKRVIKYGGVDGIPVRCGGGAQPATSTKGQQRSRGHESAELLMSPASNSYEQHTSKSSAKFEEDGSGLIGQHFRTFSNASSNSAPVDPRPSLIKASSTAEALGAQNGAVGLRAMVASPPAQSTSTTMGSNESQKENGKGAKQPRSTFQQVDSEASDEGGDDDLCVICYQEPKSVITMPCAHYAVCMNCVRRLKECSLCRKPICETIFLLRPVLSDLCKRAGAEGCPKQQEDSPCSSKAGKRRVVFDMKHKQAATSGMKEDVRLNLTGEGDLQPTPTSRTGEASATAASAAAPTPQRNLPSDPMSQTMSSSVDQEYVERLLRQLRAGTGNTSANGGSEGGGGGHGELPSLFEFDLDETVKDLIANLRDRLKKSKVGAARRKDTGNMMGSSVSFPGSHSEMNFIPPSPLATTAAPSPSNSLSHGLMDTRRKNDWRSSSSRADESFAGSHSTMAPNTTVVPLGAALRVDSGLSERSADNRSPPHMSSTARGKIDSGVLAPTSLLNQFEFEVEGDPLETAGFHGELRYRRGTRRPSLSDVGTQIVEMKLMGTAPSDAASAFMPSPSQSPTTPIVSGFKMPMLARPTGAATPDSGEDLSRNNASYASALSSYQPDDGKGGSEGLGFVSAKQRGSTDNKSFHSIVDDVGTAWGGSFPKSANQAAMPAAVKKAAEEDTPDQPAKDEGGVRGGIRKIASRLWGTGVGGEKLAERHAHTTSVHADPTQPLGEEAHLSPSSPVDRPRTALGADATN